MGDGASRLICVVSPDAGHWNPFVGILQRLEAQGHHLLVVGAPEVEPLLGKAGLAIPFRASATARTAPGPESRVKSVWMAERLANPAWARRWVKHVLIDRVPAAVETLRLAAREFRPDVICTDPTQYAGAIAAELEGIPWAGISTNFVPLIPPGWRLPGMEAFDAVEEDRRRCFESFGVRATFRGMDVISAWLNTVFATEELIPRAPTENTWSVYVGPSVPLTRRGDESPFPWEALDPQRPLIYVAFGSQVSLDGARLIELARALSSEGQVVLSVKDALPEEAKAQLPPGAVAVPYAPQLALLDRAAVMITHGGVNSVLESLSRGVPLIVAPLVNDAFATARFVTQSGAGVTVDVQSITPEGWREAVAQLVRPDSAARARAREIGGSLRAHDGAATVAELLVKLAHAARRPGGS